MESSVILEEEIDENYEPTENEILEYGLWLGLTLPEDDDLLHIAKEGLKAPLPSQWKPCKTREGDIYYFNFETGASDWEHPCDGHYKQLVKEAKQLKAKRGQESAKKKKNTSNSDFIEKSNKMKPLKRSPLGKISETGEFANRKQELEEAFAEEIDQMRHDYDDKKKELKKKTDEELNKFKSDAEKEQKAEEQRVHLEYSQKIETKKETIRLEIQKSEKERIAKENRDAIDKLEAVKNNCTNDFKEQKQKLTHRLKSESSEEIKKIEMLLSSEIETLLSELDLHKSKAERELNEQNEVTNRYNKKLERFREDSEDQLKREVKKLEKEFEWQLKVAKDEQDTELSSEDKAVLKQLEQEQFNSMQRELSEFKNKLESMIIQEKEVQARKRSKNVSKMSDEGFEKEKAQLETKLNKQKAESLAEHRRRKELEHKQELRDIELKYLDLLETEERQGSSRAKLETHDESRIFYEEKLRSLQRELAHTQNQLFNKDENLRELREDKLKLEYEAKRALVEAEDLKGKGQTIQNVVLQDLNKQILERNKELERLKFNNPNRIEKLEKELEDLKEFLIGRRRSSADPSMRRKSGHSKSRDEIVQLKQKLVVKRKEAKDIQKTLEYDQMKWRRDIQEFKANPSERRRRELAVVKKILEKQIAKHNEKVKEIRMAEDIIKENEVEYEDPLMKDEIGSEDEEKILDSWRNRGESYDIPQDVNNPQAKWAHQVKQPWHYNNVRIYQKQLNSYTKSRENIKDVFSRHNSWLNNMKDELNRAVATPVKSNMSKYLV